MWWMSSLLLDWLVWKALGRYTIWLLTSWLHHTILRGSDRTGLTAAESEGFLFSKKTFFRQAQQTNIPSVAFSFSENQFFIIPPIIHPSLSPTASFHPSPLLSCFFAVYSRLPRELGTISSFWVGYPLKAHLQGILWATLLPVCCGVVNRTGLDFSEPLN